MGLTFRSIFTKWSGFIKSNDGYLYGTPFNVFDLPHFDPVRKEVVVMNPTHEKNLKAKFVDRGFITKDGVICSVSRVVFPVKLYNHH